MSLWDSIKNAFEFRQRVEELDREVRLLRQEWADMTDVLARREERMRKRDQRAAKALVEAPEMPEASSPTIRRPGLLRGKAS